jgi:hypothetical protein
MKNMFENTNWEAKNKDIEKVKEKFSDWDTSKVSNCKEMFKNVKTQII